MPTGSLKHRSVLTILTIYLIVGALSLLAFIWVAGGISEAFGRRFAEKSVQLDKERLLGPLRREVALARKMADSEAIRTFCRDDANSAVRAAGLAELRSFRTAFADRSCFLVTGSSLHHYFGDTKAEASLPIETLDPNNINDRWYFETMDTVDDFALHVDSDVALNLLKVWINVVVKDGDRKVGLAGTGVDLSAFMHELKAGGDRSTVSIMVDPKGVLQAHPNARYMEYNAQMKDEQRRMTLFQLLGDDGDRTVLRTRLEALVKGTSGLETFHLKVEGKRYLASAIYLREIDWVAITLLDPAQVVGLRSFLPIFVLLGLSLLATIGLVSWQLNRVLLGPLARLTESSREITAGRYELVLPVERDDELGRLTGAFNHMAATIRNYTSNLEQLVAERTLALTEANRKVMDSIAYAQLIQESMLPKPETLAQHLPDHCVLFRPRDIVGGDFYALLPDSGGWLLAVGDCTGHGVPGAFMSMSAGALLSQLVAKHGAGDPALLLRELNGALKALLHQGGGAELRSGTMDNGLDLGLLRVEPGRAVYAGARIPLWTLAPGETEVGILPADAQSLGYRRSRPDFPFQNRALPLEPGTLCFLFTDGILDQHGGRFNFGFGRRRLGRFLQEHRDLGMAELGEALAGALAAYQGGNAQRDDLTFLAFRLE